MPHRKEQQELEREILELTDKLIENSIETSMLTGEEFEEKQAEGVNIVVKLAEVLEKYLGGSPEHFEQVIQELAKQKLPDENVLKSFGDFKLYLDEAIQKGLQIYLDSQQSLIHEENMETTCCLQDVTENALNTNNNVDIIPNANHNPKETLEAADENVFVETNASNIMAEEEMEHHTTKGEIVDTSFPETSEIVAATSSNDTAGPTDAAELENTANMETDDGENLAIHTQDAPDDHWMQALKFIFPGATIIKDHTLKGLSFSYFIPEYSIAIDLNPPNTREAVWKEYYCRQERIKHVSVETTEDTRIRHIVRNLRRLLAQNTIQNIS